jgi:CheY-like chemotaxis protein
LKLLLVDDEQDILDAFRRGLERLGYSLDVFLDPLEALHQFQPGEYDLALLDVRMPEMDGLELSLKLSQMDPHLRIVFLSAYDFYVLRKNYPDLSAKYFLNKPISMTELESKLRSFLEESSHVSAL